MFKLPRGKTDIAPHSITQHMANLSANVSTQGSGLSRSSGSHPSSSSGLDTHFLGTGSKSSSDLLLAPNRRGFRSTPISASQVRPHTNQPYRGQTNQYRPQSRRQSWSHSSVQPMTVLPSAILPLTVRPVPVEPVPIVPEFVPIVPEPVPIVPEPAPIQPAITAHSATHAGGGKTVDTTEDQNTFFETEECRCAFVADGHGGMNGRFAAQMAINMVTMWTQRHSRYIPTWTLPHLESCITQLFHEIHVAFRDSLVENNAGSYADENGVVRNRAHSPYHGGCTFSGTWSFIKDGKRVIHTAHVGDSDVILVSENKQSGDVTYEQLSGDHKPDNEDEYKNLVLRSDLKEKLLFVYSKSSEHYKYNSPQVFLPYVPGVCESNLHDPCYLQNRWRNFGISTGNVRYEPSTYAVTPRGARDLGSLAMTRSLGDFFVAQYGISHIPTQRTKVLDEDNFKYALFVASDGVWDCYKYQEFAELAMRKIATLSLVDVVESIVADTVTFARKTFGKQFDDTTMVVLKF